MSLPRWWGKERQEQNARSRRQEEEIATREGGRPTPGSGSSWRSPGDVTRAQSEPGDETRLVEAKFTDKLSFRLDSGVIRQHWRRASSLGKEPVIVIEFMGLDDPLLPPGATNSLRVAVVPYEG